MRPELASILSQAAAGGDSGPSPLGGMMGMALQLMQGSTDTASPFPQEPATPWERFLVELDRRLSPSNLGSKQLTSIWRVCGTTLLNLPEDRQRDMLDGLAAALAAAHEND